MKKIDFTGADIRDLIDKLKKLHYATGVYFETNINISDDGIEFKGDVDFLRELLGKTSTKD